MASGTSHDLADLILSLSLASLPFWSEALVKAIDSPVEIEFFPVLCLCSAVGVLAHLWLSPDLDLPRCNALRRWGMLRFLWKPYQRIIPCHRHVLSHLPIIGTFGRVVYLGALPVFFFGYQWLLLPEVWCIALGLALGDALHWVMDGCPVRV